MALGGDLAQAPIAPRRRRGLTGQTTSPSGPMLALAVSAVAGVRDETEPAGDPCGPGTGRAHSTGRSQLAHDSLAATRCGSSSCTTAGAACSRSATAWPTPTAQGAPGQLLLRPAGVGSPPRQFRRHRQGRRAATSLVPSRTPRHQHRRPRHADVVGRHDVRVPDAAAASARISRHVARPELPRGHLIRQIEYGKARRRRRRGASPSRPTPSPIWPATISTRRSACPASD